jgi:uncharacterized DUF497 family protein
MTFEFDPEKSATYRSDAIRIISVRRSRPEEIAIYEG